MSGFNKIREIVTKFKNGYVSKANTKYTTGFINEDNDIPMNSWKVSKSKVCYGYRSSLDCFKLYKVTNL